jgi:hypothetical protein
MNGKFAEKSENEKVDRDLRKASPARTDVKLIGEAALFVSHFSHLICGWAALSGIARGAADPPFVYPGFMNLPNAREAGDYVL